MSWPVENTLSYRPFVDSAPVLERLLAAKAGLGWLVLITYFKP